MDTPRPLPTRPLDRRALLRALALGLAAPRGAAVAAAQTEERVPLAPPRPTVPAGRRLTGGRLVLGSTIEPASLHPWDAGSVAAYDLLDGVVEGLLRFNAAGRLQPALAEGFSLSADGRSWTFALRPGVRYHDGQPFSGRDVVAAWEARLAGGWGGGSTLGWERITAIDLPDERTLVATTAEPFAPLLATVAVSPILPARVYAAGPEAFRERIGRRPIGSGPFAVAEWTAGRAIELERWKNYWGGPVTLDAISCRFLPDAAALLDGLAAGDLDATVGAGGLPPSAIGEAQAIPGLTVVEHVTRTWQHLDLKQMGFLRERAVRQALDYATPRGRIVADLLGGRATPAVADQMPGSWAAHETLRPRPFDPDRARELLAVANLRPGRDGILTRGGEPFRLELWGVAGDELAGRVLEAIAAEWAALGIAVLVRTAPPDELWGPLGYQFSDAMTACLYAWTNGPDPDDLFYWHSSQIPTAPTAPGGNLPAFFFPYAFQGEIDALTAAAASELDLETRRDLYWRIQELLTREVPVIFLYWEHAFPAARAHVGGFWPTPWAGLLWNARDWYLTAPAPDGTPAATPTDGG